MRGTSARAFMATLSTAGRLTDQVLSDRQAAKHPECATCAHIAAEGGFGPRHDGSPQCESGSIAAGGQNAHCTCNTCWGG